MKLLEELAAALLLLFAVAVGAYQWAMRLDQPAVYGVAMVEVNGRE